MGHTAKLSAQVAFICLVADQATKALARMSLPLCPRPDVPCVRYGLSSEVGFVRVANEGSAFGFAQGSWIWIALAVLGIATIAVYAKARPHPLLGLAAGLQLGGALGNLVDRIAFGGATDFIQAGPVVLNVADLQLLLGTVLGASALLLAGPRHAPERVRT